MDTTSIEMVRAAGNTEMDLLPHLVASCETPEKVDESGAPQTILVHVTHPRTNKPEVFIS